MRTPDQEALSILQELIRAKSVNPPGDITASSKVVAEVLGREGIPCEIVQGKPGVANVVARLEGSAGAPPTGKTLMFNGHLDVVPAGEDWEVDPFDPRSRDGYVWGRGSCDMKSGIASAMLAMISLKRSGAGFAGTLLLTAVGDEEVEGGFGIKYLLGRGITADYAICCEPTDMALELGNRGVLWIDVVVKGRSSHSGRPHLGVNAVQIASRLINAVSAMSFEGFRNDLFEIPVGSVSVVAVSGGTRVNVIPDRCSFSIDRRLMPGETASSATEEVLEVVRRETGTRVSIGVDDGAPVVLFPQPQHEPFWTPQDEPVAASALKHLGEVLKAKPVVRGKAAATDASHLVNIGNIPTVILGPGDPTLSHTSKERVRFQNVLRAAEVYEAMAMDLLHG